jgi:uncharacterized membrane protein
MNMNLAHLHLLINHFPTIGFIVGLGIFVFALIGKSDELKRASLVIFVGIALMTIPTYMSGSAAQEMICMVPQKSPNAPCADPGVSRAVIETHRDAALLALVFMEITGAAAWLGLWKFRRSSRPSNPALLAVLLLSIVTLALVSNAANLGGPIRHPEILSSAEASAAPTQPITGVRLGLDSGGLGKFILGVPWMWPVCETLHFIGLSLLLGVVLLVDLRMLGVMRNVSFATLHRLLPWGILGFGVNVLTGMMFFIAAPEQYTQNGAFHWKIVFVLIAGANALYFTMFDETWTLGPEDDAPFTAKFAAVSALFLWVAVMYCGSMLPFLGNAF